MFIGSDDVTACLIGDAERVGAIACLVVEIKGNGIDIVFGLKLWHDRKIGSP